MKEVILIGGFGRSGTGAVHQLLRAHKDIYALPNYEFRILTDPDGLLSLKSAVVENWNIFQADFALDRFINLFNNLGSNYSGPYVRSNFIKYFGESYFKALNQFLLDLGVVEYKGLWAGKSRLYQKIILRISRQNKFLIGNPKIRYCNNFSNEDFFSLSQKLIQNMHKNCMLETNKSFILLNEPNATQNVLSSMKLSGAKKILIVYRDPRDAFASFRTKDWSPKRISDAINYFKSVYNRWFIEKEKLNQENILEIKLESLVDNSSEQLQKLSKFLNIDINLDLIEKSNFSPINAHIGRWNKDFSIKEKEKINNEFHEILRYYNYD